MAHTVAYPTALRFAPRWHSHVCIYGSWKTVRLVIAVHLREFDRHRIRSRWPRRCFSWSAVHFVQWQWSSVVMVRVGRRETSRSKKRRHDVRAGSLRLLKGTVVRPVTCVRYGRQFFRRRTRTRRREEITIGRAYADRRQDTFVCVLQTQGTEHRRPHHLVIAQGRALLGSHPRGTANRLTAIGKRLKGPRHVKVIGQCPRLGCSITIIAG